MTSASVCEGRRQVSGCVSRDARQCYSLWSGYTALSVLIGKNFSTFVGFAAKGVVSAVIETVSVWSRFVYFVRKASLTGRSMLVAVSGGTC